ncbi:MAG: cell division protein ZipA [Gammaproteobacteria bacterium]
MDFDLRQWLMILGPVFIIGVLLHGYLRMRAGQNQIRMKLEKEFISGCGDDVEVDDLNLLRAELPNGGARVIAAGEREAEARATEAVPAAEEVPMLVESVDLPAISAVDNLPEVDELPVISATDTPAADTPAPDMPVAKAPPAKAPSEETPPSKPEKFVVINILALDEPFPGQHLLEILVNADMSFGDMDIFHKLLPDGEPAFSLASAVVPGTFNPATMETFSTPGVTLFMRVHELAEPVKVLDDMLAVAESIAVELGGEICDESRSVMTPQTIEHCRQSIQEFQFRHSA